MRWAFGWSFRGVATAGLAMVMCLAPSRADDGKRDALKSEIASLLASIASELRDVPGDSSASDLERTFGMAADVARKASDLKGHEGEDSDAKTITSAYESYAAKYQDAARYLREVKNNQRGLDEFPRQCEDRNKELTEKVWRFVQQNDPRGLEDIPRLARDAAQLGRDVLQKAERLRNDLVSYADRADDFSESHAAGATSRATWPRPRAR